MNLIRKRIYVVDVDGYCYLIPYIKNGKQIFLKTIIPSRKATKQYFLEAKNERIMMENYKLSKEEKEILKSFENSEINHGTNKNDNFMKEKQIAMQAAESFTKKSERINIRLTPYDLDHIKRIAAKEGMPYQTLISSILHKYAAGYLRVS